jgi:hypothetical protein
MRTVTLTTIHTLLVLSCAPFLLSPPFVSAQDRCFTDFSTITGEVTYEAGWLPEWDAGNPGEMAPESCEPFSLSGGTAPFSWHIEGGGFWFDEEHTLTEQVTDTGSIEVCADEAACGTATITVIDGFGVTVTGYVKSTQGGWYVVEEAQCSGWQREWCAFCTCEDTFEVGPFRYQNVWIGDKSCQMTEESCGPYPKRADLKRNKCYVAGFYTPSSCDTFFYRTKWEWRCPP